MKRVFIALASFAAVAVAGAMVVVYQGPLVNETALAYNKDYTLDTYNTKIDYIGAQAVYAKAAPAAVTFTDGATSTMSLTVSSLSGLTTSYASNKITVVTNSALSGAVITFNGTALTEGIDWGKAAVSSNTAVSLKAAIDRKFSTSLVTTLATGGTVIYATATSVGNFANAYTLTSSTQAALTVNSATFAGGQNNASISINNVPLYQGTDWIKGATSSATAKAISDAIMANASLNTIIASTWSAGGVVTATSTAQGTASNYSLSSSTAALVFAPTSAMAGGSGNNIDITNSKINKANTFTTGLALLYTKTAGTSPANLVAGTTYYGIAVDLNNFKLATSTTNAVAGTNISISTTATGAGGSFTLTPLAYAGTPSFKWQASNDGTNYTDLSVSSITYTAASTTASSTLWDLAAYDYRYLKCSVTAPTAGGFALVVTLQGKNTGSK